MVRRKVETRLCTSVSADSPEELANKATLALSLGSDLVELRIDKLKRGISPRELEAELSVFAQRAVFTVRSSREGGAFRGGEAQRLELISRLAAMGPAYLDIELSTAKENKSWVESLPGDVERIASWHDFKGTPELKALRSNREEGLEWGSLAKIVTTAKSVDDNLKTLALCADDPDRTVSFSMGELGMVSRVVSLHLGAPLAYASLPDEAVAPGQISISTMRTLRSMVV
ncbi:MAG TPA: type I 3-dehydroquinate dehydratase [Nitrososphaerales archaeon]|nr:type I 3-dehydroquinate dehydratase [Nitrososphaerales archaeon]